MTQIPSIDFDGILAELQRKPLDINHYRSSAGQGRSQAFGVVNRRSLPPDYSRQSWRRPYLYKLLLDFGKKHVAIPWNAITVNDNYQASAHRDKGNVGESFLVAFGNYQGGCLTLHEGDLKGSHAVRHTPLITDFGATLHSVEPWTGHRCSLVFYTAARTPEDLPQPSVEFIDGSWVFKRGGVVCSGLPHPIKVFRLKKELETLRTAWDAIETPGEEILDRYLEVSGKLEALA